MELLKQKIRTDGRVLDGNVLKVDGFLNHQIDVELISKVGEEFHRIYGDCGITKILTIEASGIGIACLVAQHFGVPVLFAKKSKSSNIGDDVYSSTVHSYTHNRTYDILVSKNYLKPTDRVLVIDDFLAMGSALEALISLIREAGAELVGCGIVIEKAYQPGGKKLRDAGVRIESLARIASMSAEDGVTFC